jgi:hypothetical protein
MIDHGCGRTVKGKPIGRAVMSGNNDAGAEKASQMGNSSIGADEKLGRLNESSDFLRGTSYRVDDSVFLSNSIPDFINPFSFGATAGKNHMHLGISFEHVLDHFLRGSNGKRSFRS